jgi:hypothetical protein
VGPVGVCDGLGTWLGLERRGMHSEFWLRNALGNARMGRLTRLDDQIESGLYLERIGCCTMRPSSVIRSI